MKTVVLCTLTVLFATLPAYGQQVKERDTEERAEAPEVEAAELPTEVEASPEVQAKLDAEQQARDDAPFVATLDNPVEPDETFPDVHIVTAEHLEPVPEKPIVLAKMKSAPIHARHIAIMRHPPERGAKATTEVASRLAKSADGICGGKAKSTDHIVRPCAPKEKP